MPARGDGSNAQTGDLLDNGLGALIESSHYLRHCRCVASGHQENARHHSPKSAAQIDKLIPWIKGSIGGSPRLGHREHPPISAAQDHLELEARKHDIPSLGVALWHLHYSGVEARGMSRLPDVASWH
jgi:hypothetical protein